LLFDEPQLPKTARRLFVWAEGRMLKPAQPGRFAKRQCGADRCARTYMLP